MLIVAKVLVLHVSIGIVAILIRFALDERHVAWFIRHLLTMTRWCLVHKIVGFSSQAVAKEKCRDMEVLCLSRGSNKQMI